MISATINNLQTLADNLGYLTPEQADQALSVLSQKELHEIIKILKNI